MLVGYFRRNGHWHYYKLQYLQPVVKQTHDFLNRMTGNCCAVFFDQKYKNYY